MLITKEITIDLLHRGVTEPVEAVQCDANTRAVKVTLLNGGESWTPPNGAVASVAYKKPDGTSGWYDKLPDGTTACSITDNTVTAIFAPQMLTAAGKVQAAVIFQDSRLNQLATFVFTVAVQANPAAGKGISNDYYKYSTMEQLSAAVDAWLTETEAEKNAFLSKAGAALEAMREVITASDSAPAIVCEKSGAVVSVSDSDERLLKGLTLYGKTTQNGIPSPTSPVELVSVGASGAIKTIVCGGNLYDYSKDTANYRVNTTTGLLEWTSGNQSASDYIRVKPNTAYTINYSYFSSANYGMAFYDEEKNYISGRKQSNSSVSSLDSFTFVTPLNCAYIRITSADRPIAKIILNEGSASLPFEPYKEQNLSASTPNGLPGIPVSSGGNYTDENGQQWICDEVDFARGVYVKRITKLVLKGSEAFIASSVQGVYRLVIGNYDDGINVEPWETEQRLCCSHFRVLEKYYPGANRDFGTVSVYMSNGAYELSFKISDKDMATYATEQYTADNPVTVIYPGKPIETALSAEEMAAYYALHSNKPNTTAFTDAGAGMKLSYVADTKLYIDNKFGELAAALVHNT